MTADQYKGLKIRDNGCVGGLVGTILSANLDKGTLTVSWKHGSFCGLSLEKIRQEPGRYTIEV
jgi:hypothetical protein